MILTNINPKIFISYHKRECFILLISSGAYAQSDYISNTTNVANPNLDKMYIINQYFQFWIK